MHSLLDLPAQALAKAQQHRRTRRGGAALPAEDDRVRRVPARAAAEPGRDGRRHPPLGRDRDGARAQCAPHAQPAGGHRRRGLADLQGTRRRRQRGGQRSAGDGRQGRRRGRHPGPQPPLVRDRQLRCRPRRCPHDHAQHRVLRSPDQGRVGARRRPADHLRRRVHRGRQAVRPAAGQAAGARHQPGQGRAVGQHRRDAGRAHRPQQHRARAEGDEAVVDRHPHQRHHRHAEGSHPAHPADAGADRRCALECAVQGRRGDLAAVADVPRAGLPARHDRADAGHARWCCTGGSSRRRCSRTSRSTR